ncbi:hypothetical protein [Deinococcus radiophilus]|uniref:hypothetical protein n=1 Tax=Deinococcus radiophilus TaxID=32062 RepID=UPI00360B6266
MFRFNRPKKDEAPGASDERVLVAAQNDPTRVLADLLGKPNVEGLLEGALEHAASLLGGNVKGYAVLRKGQDTVSAVRGYPKTLLGLSLSGPGRRCGPACWPTVPKSCIP